MFGTLNERLEKIVNSIKGKAIISEPDVDLTMREIRIALLGSGCCAFCSERFYKKYQG